MAEYILLYTLTPDNWPEGWPRDEHPFVWPHVKPARNADDPPTILTDKQLAELYAATPRDMTADERTLRHIATGVLVRADADDDALKAAKAKTKEYDAKAARIQLTRIDAPKDDD